MNYLAAFFYDFCFKDFFELSENDTKKKNSCWSSLCKIIHLRPVKLLLKMNSNIGIFLDIF